MDVLIKLLAAGTSLMSIVMVAIMVVLLLVLAALQWPIWRDKSPLRFRIMMSGALGISTLWGAFLTYKVGQMSWEIIQYLR